MGKSLRPSLQVLGYYKIAKIASDLVVVPEYKSNL